MGIRLDIYFLCGIIGGVPPNPPRNRNDNLKRLIKMNNAEEKIVEKWRIRFRVIEHIEAPLYHFPVETTILRGNQRECVAELRDMIHHRDYLDIIEMEEVK